MKIKRLAGNLFWAGSPKAGMFFGMTVALFLLCVVVPALSYVAFAAPPIAKYPKINWMLISVFADYDQKVRPLLLFLPLFLYITILTWRYHTCLLRTVFSSKRRYAVPLGFVAAVAPLLGLFGVVLPCAIKARVRKAMLSFAAMTACLILAIAANVSDAIRPVFAVAWCLAAHLFYVAAIFHLPPGRAGGWAFAAAVLPIALVVVLAVADVGLEKQIQKLEAEFHGQSRISMTAEEFKEELRSGISTRDPPYDILFSEVAQLHDMPRTTPHGVDGWPNEEQNAQFEAFAATNAELLVKIDAITAQRNLNFADDVVCNRYAIFPPASFSPPRPYIKLGNWYLAKGRRAALRGDKTTAADSFDRVDNMSTWLAHKADTPSQLYYLTIEHIKLFCLEAATPVLSDAEIAVHLKRVRVDPRDFIQRCRMNRIASFILFEDVADAIAEKGLFGGNRSPGGKPFLPFVRFYLKLEKRCALAYVIHDLKLFDGAALSESEFYDRLAGDDYDLWVETNVRMPMSRMLLFSYLQYESFAKAIDRHRSAEIGLAVEQYRRRHGTLPEELEALVPEFLDSLPLSHATGRPFDYQRGAFDIPLLRGKTGRITGYRVFSRQIERRPSNDPCFVVSLGNAAADEKPQSQGTKPVVNHVPYLENDT